MEATRYRERLIEEVKRYPVLYNTRHDQHRDIDVRDRCWQEIAERLGSTSESLKREWKILRDSMRQAVKRNKQGAKTKSGLPCKPWRLHSNMEFLLPYITMRERRSIRDDMKLDESEAPSDAEQSQSKRSEEAWPPADDHDGLELFFASVCHAAKRLPRALTRRLKRQVLDALLQAEEDYDADPRTKTESKQYDDMD